MAKKKTDQYLLENLINSNGKDSEEIYTMFFQGVSRYIRNHDGTEQDAKEVFHKGLLLLIIKARDKNFVITSTLEGYFLTICKNVWRREKKISKNRVTKEGPITLVHEEREIALTVMEQERWELFQEKLSEISENCSKLLGYFFKKVSYQEIAKKLAYNSENVVRQRIFKCKAKLKEAIQNDPRYNELKEL